MNRQKTVHGAARPESLRRSREAKQCAACGLWFSLPACHAPRHRACSAKCGSELYRRQMLERQRPCACCGGLFIPRRVQVTNGRGRYCSVACVPANIRLAASMTPDAKARRVASWKKVYKALKGSDNPRWQGGPIESRRRAQARGVLKERIKKYRAGNPDKVREWAASRSRRKFGKLPRGTVSGLMREQDQRCAICLVALDASFHVDHKLPLSRGGKHEVANVQLLCATCNVRKWAYTTEEFMARGRR